LARQEDRYGTIVPTHLINLRRNISYFMASPPDAGGHHKIAQGSRAILNNELKRMPKTAVAALAMIANNSLATSQIRVRLLDILSQVMRAIGSE
jgi:hypothetical protein